MLAVVDGTARWELLRALGAALLTPPAQAGAVWEALEIDTPTGADYTEVVVLGAPPHEAIHLGPEGQLGGEGLDRVAGFWRALGRRPPEDADHLGALLLLYAGLGAAEAAAAAAGDEGVAGGLRRSREALLHEHLWSWAPAYLVAVGRLDVPALAEWAGLALSVLRVELADAGPATRLPLALREAPEGVTVGGSLDGALDALLAPIRSGLVITHRDLQEGAHRAGVGYRRGERRFALKAMLQQDSDATLVWLIEHTGLWRQLREDLGDDATNQWWLDRVGTTCAALQAQRVMESVDRR